MIHTVRLSGFKCLHDVEIKLERLTALVGPNGCGKSSVLQGLHFLSRLGKQAPEAFFTGQRDPAILLSRGQSDGMRLSMEWNADLDGKLVIGIGREKRGHGGLVIRPSGWERRWKGRSFDEQPDNGSWDLVNLNVPVARGAPEMAEFLDRVVFLRLNPELLAAPALTDVEAGRLEENGGNLAAILADMKLGRYEQFQRLQEALRAVVPEVKEVRLDRVQLGERVWGRQIGFDFKGASNVPAYAASEGTLLVLGLLAAMFHTAPPPLVLLDDLDRALHPKAQRDLVVLVRRLLDQFPEMQILATSHSPYLLDHLRFEEVRVMTLGEDGGAICAPLDRHPEIERWRDVMHPGEFWSTVGERWANEVGSGSGRGE